MSYQIKATVIAIMFALIAICLVSTQYEGSDAEGTSWYIDSDTTDEGDGTVQNPWKELSSISWTSIKDGDTLFISGEFNDQTLTILKEVNVLGSTGSVYNGPGDDGTDRPTIEKVVISWDDIDFGSYGQYALFETHIEGVNIGEVGNSSNEDKSSMYVTVTFENCSIGSFTNVLDENVASSQCKVQYTVTFDHCSFTSKNVETAIDVVSMEKIIVLDCLFEDYPTSISIDGAKGSFYQDTGEYEPITVFDSIFTIPSEGVGIALSGDLKSRNTAIRGNTVYGGAGSVFITISNNVEKNGGDNSAEIVDNVLAGVDSIVRYESSDDGTASNFDINLNGNAQISNGEYLIPNVISAGDGEISSEVMTYSYRTDENTISSTELSTTNWSFDLSTGTMTFKDCEIPVVSNATTSLGSTTGQFSWRQYRESVTKLVLDNVDGVGGYAFDQFIALQSVNMTGSGEIGNFAFRTCPSLVDVSIGEGFTYVGQGAFRYCTSLTEISLPESMESAGTYVFYGCSSLTTADLGGIINIKEYNNMFSDTSISSLTVCEGCNLPSSIRNITTLETVTVGNKDYSITAGGDLVEPVETGDGIWFVDAQSGNDSNDGKSPKTAWKTINNNLSKIESGDTIMLNGELESANIDKLVNVIGYGVAIFVNNLSINWETITGNSDNISGDVLFKDLTFKRMTLQDEGVLKYDLSNVHLTWENCTFKTDNAHMSLVLYGNYHVSVKDCLFIGSDHLDNTYGIFANNCSSLTVTGCTFENYVRSINADSIDSIDITNTTFELDDNVLAIEDSIRVIQVAGDSGMTEIKGISVFSNVGGDAISIHESLSPDADVTVTESSFNGMDVGIVYQVGTAGISQVHVEANNNYYVNSNGDAVPILVGSSDGIVEVPENLVSNDVYYTGQDVITGDNQYISVVPDSDGNAYVLSSEDYYATVTVDFGEIELVVKGTFQKGVTIIRAYALTSEIPYDAGYEIDTPLKTLSELSVSVDIDVPEGKKLVDASVYRQEDDGSFTTIDDVSIYGNTVLFITNSNSVYLIDAVFESIPVETKYTVTFKSEGSADITWTVGAGTTIDVMDFPTFTREDYLLSHWVDESDNTVSQTEVNSNMVLTAVWVKVYDLAYAIDGELTVGGSVNVTLTAGYEPGEGIIIVFLAGAEGVEQQMETSATNVGVVTITSPGTYMFSFVAMDASDNYLATGYVEGVVIAYTEEPGTDPEQPDIPIYNPGWSDDDYVPLPPQIVYEDDKSDDTTTIVACAAAAVVAALMAAFLVMEYRKD